MIAVGFAKSEPAPEQPAWSESGAAASAPQDDAAPPPPAPATKEAETANETDSPPAKSDSIEPPATDFTENISQSGMDPAAQIGVPDSTNFFLPKLDDYGQPFFERQGLRFRFGPVQLRMNLGLGAEYNDNIFGSSTDPIADIISTITPTFLVGMGDFQTQAEDYLRLEYQPQLAYYVTYPDQNRVNQSLDLSAHATFSRYVTEVSLTYTDNNQPSATQSGLQNYQILNFNWSNSYYLSPKVFAQLTIGASNQNYENGDNYTTYNVSPQLGYEYSPKTTLFFGPTAGISYISNSNAGSSSYGTQSFQGFNLGITYNTLRKLTFQATFGVQSRQYNGLNASGASNFTTPIFNIGMTYTPRQKTSITLALVRDVQISNLQLGQTYTNNSIQGSLTQQLTSKLAVSLGLAYQYLQYQGDSSSTDPRNDQYVAFSPQATYTFWRDECSISVYYRGQMRSSNLESQNYTINVYGVQFLYKF